MPVGAAAPLLHAWDGRLPAQAAHDGRPGRRRWRPAADRDKTHAPSTIASSARSEPARGWVARRRAVARRAVKPRAHWLPPRASAPPAADRSRQRRSAAALTLLLLLRPCRRGRDIIRARAAALLQRLCRLYIAAAPPPARNAWRPLLRALSAPARPCFDNCHGGRRACARPFACCCGFVNQPHDALCDASSRTHTRARSSCRPFPPVLHAGRLTQPLQSSPGGSDRPSVLSSRGPSASRHPGAAYVCRSRDSHRILLALLYHPSRSGCSRRPTVRLKC